MLLRHLFETNFVIVKKYRFVILMVKLLVKIKCKFSFVCMVTQGGKTITHKMLFSRAMSNLLLWQLFFNVKTKSLNNEFCVDYF